jgi:hypothetical protein
VTRLSAERRIQTPVLLQNLVRINSLVVSNAAESVRCGAMENSLASNRARTSRLQTKWSWCESGSGFKKEIPVKTQSPAQVRSRLVDGASTESREEHRMISQLSASQSSICHKSRQSAVFAAIAAALAFLATYPAGLRAQGMGSSMPQAAAALTGDQQSAANSALCAAIASQVPNPAAATPSVLNSPGVISAAASTFASSTKLPLPSATSMLQGYVAQHATEILASCAASNATSGPTSKIPGASSIPSMPKMPY